MSQFKNMRCWEIMQCSNSENCPARKNPDIPCWEIAEQLKTTQCIMNICDDCIVHLVKTSSPVLTTADRNNILHHRNNRPIDSCPMCEGTEDGKKS